MSEQTKPQPRPRKPRFLRDTEWVAVKPVRLSTSETIRPGEAIPENFRRHHLRSLWHRNAIAPKGSEYAAFMLGILARQQERRGTQDAEELTQTAIENGAAVDDTEPDTEPDNSGDTEPDTEPQE